MNDSTKKKTESVDFQTFISYPEQSSVMVSKQLLEEMSKKPDSVINKYLKFDYFLKSISDNYFYLASPSTWDDPFETKYLDALDDPNYTINISEDSITKLKDMSIFCSCMTFNKLENEEGSWKSYGDEIDQLIRISFDFDALCNILSKNNTTIYIGKMDYKQRKEIVSPTPLNYSSSPNSDTDLEVLLVNNFCFKQIAYHYENELRFCKVMRGETYKESKDYKIENVDLLPAIKQITLPPIKNKESKSKEIEQITKYLLLKVLCPNISIHISNLYNPNKLEMTSEIDI